MSLLTAEIIRTEIADRDVADNLARMKLTFDPDDIANAIQRAAKNFNIQPPYSITIDPNLVPDNAAMIEGTIAALYRVGLHRLRRNHVAFQAGNSVTPFSETQIQQYEKIVTDAEARCREMTRDLKLQANIDQAFGIIY